MKKALIFTAVLVGIGATIYYIAVGCIDTKHKYEITYNHGKYHWSDYTDTFNLTNTSVSYTDERGAEVIRYGSFAIKKNVNFKK